MKEKFLPWFLLFCALGLSGTAAYYSVVGLSVVFVGVALPVIIMGSFLEVSKIAIATYLHDKWKETYGVLKIYLTIALVTLSLITSLGIYGLLSTGFQENIAKLEIGEKQVKNVEVKKKRFEEIKDELNKEKTTLDGDITKLRDGLSNNTTTQSVDRKTGQLITKENNNNRKSFEGQLKEAQTRRDTISKKIDSFNDSITKLDVDILNMESKEIGAGELGAIKYLSEVLGWDIKRTANLFILILIFVFDPLAITLVIATNQAFKGKRKDEDSPQVPRNYHTSAPQVTEHDTIHDEVEIPESYLTHHTPQVEDDTNVTHKEETDQVPTDYRPSTDQVDPVIIEKIVEVPVYIDKNDVPVDEYFEKEELMDLQDIKKDVEEKIKNNEEIINQVIQNYPKRLSYSNRNGGSVRINRI
jgi:hypothetical protein